MGEITELLQSAAAGDVSAANQLYERVYPELKRLAQSRLYGAGPASELDPTSLVHECFLRLCRHGQLQVSERAAFFAYVGRVMRSVVVDHVRAHSAQKRGGGNTLVTLTTSVESSKFDEEQLLALDAALDELDKIAPAYRELVEQRYFTGLSIQEIAELQGTSTRTIEREWQKARAFLRQLLSDNPSPPVTKPG